MKLGSLFTGMGGLDMAVEAVTGAQTVWCSDIDPGASKILAHRYPDVPNLGDLTAIDWTAVEPVDIITGGFPCQDLSHAGKRAGLKHGTRSGLWSYMAEAIETLRPRLVVAENVRGLLSAEALRPVEPCPWCVGDEPVFDVRALGAVLADLADIGYVGGWHGLRAADVGACHGRFRVLLVAYPNGSGGGEWWDAAPGQATSGRSHADDRGRGGTPGLTLLGTPRATTSGMTPSARMTARGETKGRLEQQVELLPTPRATDGTKGGPNQRGSSGDLMLPSAVNLLPTPSVADVQGGRKGRSGERSGELLLNGLAHEQRFGQYAAAIARHEAAFGREAPAPTEPTGRNGAHRLSPRFVEWMMGLPDGWITDVPGVTRNEALRALGNGVVPQQAEAALRLLLSTIEAAAA